MSTPQMWGVCWGGGGVMGRRWCNGKEVVCWGGGGVMGRRWCMEG